MRGRACPRLLVLLAAAVLGGCARRDGEPLSSVRSQRLLDRIDAARIDSTVDPSDPSGGGAVRFRGHLADVPAPWTAVLRHAPLARALFGPLAEGAPVPAIRFSRIQVARDRPLLVRVRPGRGARKGDDPLREGRWCAIDVAEPLSPGRLRDPDWWMRVLRPRRVQRLRPADGDGLRALVERAPPSHALVLAAVADGGAGAEVEVRALSPLGEFLQRSPSAGHSPWVRRVRMDQIVREALVLGPPCRATWSVELPAGVFALTAWAALTPGPGAGAASLDVEVAAENGRRAARIETPAGRWAEVRLDLAGLRGAAEISFRCADRRAGALFLLAQAEVRAEPAGPLPPDILLVSLDTLRADALGVYGSKKRDSPVLDAFARDSLVFENAIAAAPWTLPSHVTMLSGLLPDRHGQTSVLADRPEGLPWLPSLLRQAGYRTLAFASGGYVDPVFGFATGFERYGAVDPAKPPEEWARARPVVGGVDMKAKAERSRLERERLLRTLERRRDRPLFVFVHTYAPHDYRVPPSVLRELGAREDEMEALLDGVYGAGAAARGGTTRYFATDLDEEERRVLSRRARLLYRGAVRVTDRFVGRILEALRSSGRYERTILAITSDHGEELFERGRLGHGHSLFEEQIRVPWFLHAPGFEPRRVSEVVSGADLAPTLLALAHRDGRLAGPEPSFDGRDLSALLAGGAIPPRPALARGGGRSPAERVRRALRTARFKWIEEEDARGRSSELLFDLATDPAETEDLHASLPEVATRMRAAMERLVGALRRRSLGAAGTAALPREVEEELRALGYLEGG